MLGFFIEETLNLHVMKTSQRIWPKLSYRV